jgi:hypothetical protein
VGFIEEGECPKCLKERLLTQMRQIREVCLYVTKFPEGYFATDFFGNLEFRLFRKVSHPRDKVKRIDYWFWFEGFQWHGVDYRQDKEVVYFKRTRTTVAKSHHMMESQNV